LRFPDYVIISGIIAGSINQIADTHPAIAVVYKLVIKPKLMGLSQILTLLATARIGVLSFHEGWCWG
jgi:hypothetical protein